MRRQVARSRSSTLRPARSSARRLTPAAEDVALAAAAARNALKHGRRRRRGSDRPRCSRWRTRSRATSTSSPSSRRPAPGIRSSSFKRGRAASDRRLPALLRRRCALPRRQGLGRVRRGLHLDRPPRGGRRRRPDRALELPADDGRMEDRAGARRRQHRRPQAGAEHPQTARRMASWHRRSFPRAFSTSSAAATRPARRWSPTTTSTWSRSRARSTPARLSPRPRLEDAQACPP